MNTPLEARLVRSANWFYWIAGLSLINAFAMKTNFQFILGSAAVEAAPSFGQTAMIVIDAAVVGGFALFGYLAGRRHTWAFIVGMVLYTLDGVLYLMGQDYIPVLFHAFVLYVLFTGLQASIALNAMPQETRTMVMPHALGAQSDEPSPPAS